MRLHLWSYRVLDSASRALYYLLYDTPLQPPSSTLGGTAGTQGLGSDGLANTDSSLGVTTGSSGPSSPGKKHKKRGAAMGSTFGGTDTYGNHINHLPRLRGRLVARGAVEVLLVALAAQLAIAQSSPSRGDKDGAHSVSHSSATEHACAALASIVDASPQGKEAMGQWRDPGITSALPLPPTSSSGGGGGGHGSHAFDVLFTTLRFHKFAVGACEQGLRLLVLSTEGLGDNQRQVRTDGSNQPLLTPPPPTNPHPANIHPNTHPLTHPLTYPLTHPLTFYNKMIRVIN